MLQLFVFRYHNYLTPLSDVWRQSPQWRPQWSLSPCSSALQPRPGLRKLGLSTAVTTGTSVCDFTTTTAVTAVTTATYFNVVTIVTDFSAVSAVTGGRLDTADW